MPGSAGELRLRDGAASIAAAVPTAERRATADERIGLVCADVEPDWVTLGAVVIPYPSRESDEIEVVTVPPSAAVFRLLAFPRVHGLRSPIVLRRQFEMLSELLRRVPVYEVVVPGVRPTERPSPTSCWISPSRPGATVRSLTGGTARRSSR